MKTKPQPKIEERRIEEKLIKHEFSDAEKSQICVVLALAIVAKRGFDEGFDQVTAAFKARQFEIDARIWSISAHLVNGFEMRTKRCAAILVPEKGLKYFVALGHPALDGDPSDVAWNEIAAAVEDMRPEDFQKELTLVGSMKPVTLWGRPGGSTGKILLATKNGFWYSALEIEDAELANIHEVFSESMPRFKDRFDAILHAEARLLTWLPKDLREKFQNQICKVVEAEKGKLE